MRHSFALCDTPFVSCALLFTILFEVSRKIVVLNIPWKDFVPFVPNVFEASAFDFLPFVLPFAFCFSFF